jgi:hypothetical protein
MAEEKEKPGVDPLQTPTSQSTVRKRRPYVSPRLETYGDIRTLTTGGSPGVGDSGSTTTRRPLPF